MSKKNISMFEKEFSDDIDSIDWDIDSLFEKSEEVYLAINLYIFCNGYLSLENLKKLLKKSGVKFNEKDIKKYKSSYFEYDNLYFYDTYILNLYKNNGFRNNGNYKIFDKNEIISLFTILNFIIPYTVIEELSAVCKRDSETFFIQAEEEIEKVYNAILNDEDAQGIFEKIILKYKIPKNKCNSIYYFFNVMKNFYPSRKNGGMSLYELNDEKDIRTVTLNAFLNILGGNKTIQDYFIIMYIKINGVIALNDLQRILHNEHNIDLSINEIKEIIKNNENENIFYNNKYANCVFNNKELIKLVLLSKRENPYYIIDNPELLYKEFILLVNNCIDLFDQYNLNEKTLALLLSFIGTEVLEEDFNSIILGNLNLINEKEIHDIYNKFCKILYNFRKWKYNGYKENEIDSI